jgi:cobalamin biosynthesis Mg chelatase CobN
MYQLNLADKNLYASLESDAQILNTENTAPEWNETRYSETNLAPFVAYDNGDENKKNMQTTQPQQDVTGVDVNEPTTIQQPVQAAQPQAAQPQAAQSQAAQSQTAQSQTAQSQAAQSQTAQPQAAQSAKQQKPKRSTWGFIKFALIVILIALIIYFTLYRIGWGVSECAKRNYHDCAALLTPELSALALTSIAL